MDFKWYELVNGEEITQGDIIFDCPVYKPIEIIDKEDGKKHVKGEIEIIDVIVMTQACDIAQGNVTDIILCSLIDVVESNIGKSMLGQVKNGSQPRYHLISKSDVEEFPMGYKMVEFINIYSLSLDALRKVAVSNGSRLRLLPPYKEHLSQAFARYFMRVGLPYDIDINDIQKSKASSHS